MNFDAQRVDPTIMEMVTRALLQVVEAFLRVGSETMTYLEQYLRVSLDSINVVGDLQTLIVALVPILCLALALRVMGGFLRLIAVAVLVVLLLHILAPVVQRYLNPGEAWVPPSSELQEKRKTQ